MEIWIDIPGYEGMYQASMGDNIRHGFDTGLYRNSQKPITVLHSNTNEVIHFPYLACLDRFLFRRTGYSSERLKRNHFTFISKYGDCYRLVSVNE